MVPSSPEEAATPIAERLIRDPRISFKAKGLFALLASLRDNERVSPESIALHSTDGVAAVRSALQELVSFGYLHRGQARREDGTLMPIDYVISDLGRPRLDVPTTADERAHSVHGFAYAIADPSSSHVKIGCSINPQARLRGLQTGWPRPLSILWTAPGGAAMEAHLHARFTRRRIRGEWFDFAGVDAVALISQAAATFEIDG